MANWSTLNMEIISPNVTEAGKIHAAIQQANHTARKAKTGMFIGSTTRYLFESDFDHLDDSIYLFGMTRWTPSHQEFADWVRWFMGHGQISELEMRYEESGNLVYGCYTFDGTMLSDRYLPSQYFPEYDESDPDSWSEILRAALNKHGERTCIGKIAA
jgi:hypothetical protein